MGSTQSLSCIRILVTLNELLNYDGNGDAAYGEAGAVDRRRRLLPRGPGPDAVVGAPPRVRRFGPDGSAVPGFRDPKNSNRL